MPKLLAIAMIAVGLAWMPASEASACEDYFGGWWNDLNTGIRYMHRIRDCNGYLYRYVNWDIAY